MIIFSCISALKTDTNSSISPKYYGSILNYENSIHTFICFYKNKTLSDASILIQRALSPLYYLRHKSFHLRIGKIKIKLLGNYYHTIA